MICGHPFETSDHPGNLGQLLDLPDEAGRIKVLCVRRTGNDFACLAARNCPSSRQVRCPGPPCCSCTDLRAPR